MSHEPRSHDNCLHLLAGSGDAALRDCLAHCTQGDTLFLLDAGVLQLLKNADALRGASGCRLCFASADLDAQGLAALAEQSGFEIVEDRDFPGLLRDHRHCVTWT